MHAHDKTTISVALTRDIRRYPWHWHEFCIVQVAGVQVAIFHMADFFLITC